MKIVFANEINKRYIEMLPSIAFSWYSDKVLHAGWLFWNVGIYF